MDWGAIISELGGGLSAVVIAALAYAYWSERRRTNELMDRAIQREREQAQELASTISAVDRFVRTFGVRE